MRRPGSPLHTRRSPRSGADGFSIVELMLAIFVLAVVMSAVAAALGTAMRTSRSNTNRVVAANLASEQLDMIREDASQDFDKLIALLGHTTVTRKVGSIPYTVSRDASWVSGGAGNSPCDGSATATAAYVRVTVTVTWSALAGVVPVTTQTVITPPVGVYDPNTGNAAIKVLSAAGKPQVNIKVDLTGPAGAEPSQYTTTDGCAFFPFLDAGAYTATISAVGYADRQGVTSPSKTIGVNVATTTPFPFEYDILGGLTATLRPLYDASGPVYAGVVPNNVPLTLYNTGFQPTGLKVFTGAGSPRSIPSLYPFTAGYVAWTGSCTDADPDQYGTNLRPPAISVPPGVTSTGSVVMPSFTVRVQRLGVDVPTAHLTLTHAAGPGCTTGQTLTYDAAAVTDSNGRLTLGVPYGTWTVTVDGSSPNTTWPVVTVTPLDSQPRPELNVSIL
jgi:type II secretory pathway pseudopilin PulG